MIFTVTQFQNHVKEKQKKIDITTIELDLVASNHLSAVDVLTALQNKIDERIKLDDFIFEKVNSEYGRDGSATIQAESSSIYIIGSQTLTWNALEAKNLSELLNNFSSTNETSKQEVINALNKELNNDPKIDEGDISFEKQEADFGKDGKIVIKTTNEAKLVGQKELVLTRKSQVDITSLELEVSSSNSLSAGDVLTALQNKIDKRIQLSDFKFDKVNSDYGRDGSATIQAETSSIYITGSQILTWNALEAKNLSELLNNFSSTNETSKQEVINALNKELNNDPKIDEGDISFEKQEADFGKDGKIVIKTTNEAKLVGQKELILTRKSQVDITSVGLEVSSSNSLSAGDILTALQNKIDKRIQLSDFKFDKVNSDYGRDGSATIQAETSSIYITGSQTLTWNALEAKNLSELLNNFSSTNETSKQEVINALNKELNNDPKIDEGDISFEKQEADFGKDGKIIVKTTNEAKLIGQKELVLTRKSQVDISKLNLGLDESNSLTEDKVLSALKQKVDSRITKVDFGFGLILADYGKEGQISIYAKTSSIYLSGRIQKTFSALPAKNLSSLLNNFKATNETSKQEVINALNKELNNDPKIESNDISFNLNSSDYNKDGKVTISSLNTSKIVGKKEVIINAVPNIDISKFTDLELKLAKDSMIDNKVDVLKILREKTGENRITEQDFSIDGVKTQNTGMTKGSGVYRGYITINGKGILTGYLSFYIYPVGDVLFQNIFNLDIQTPNKSTSVFYNKEQGGAIKQEMRRRVRETLNYDSDVFWNKINIVVDTSRKVIFVSNENSDGIKVDNPGGALWLYKGQFPYVYY